MSKLPPLTAIRAFEAAARLGSFTQAATELGLTQAAISYQVKQLEDRVGAPLFLRQARKVVLSEAGKRLAPAVAEAFQRLALAFDALRNSDENVLSLTAVSTFCTNWLVPRLGTFQMAHPDIAVRLDMSSRWVDFAREEFDLGIRSGSGAWPGLAAHRLLPLELTVYASPEFLASAGSIAAPADLLHLPLLDWTDNSWRLWFRAAGIPDPQPSTGPNIMAPTQQILGNAAMAGQGVALLTPAFFRTEIAAGRLVQVLPIVSREPVDYWLVYPQDRRNQRKIRVFKDWLLQQVRAEGIATFSQEAES
ncbi:MAG: transcriptional regulator GcvA [Proteobacteria bacterium]|nr:transcriptional regulator GcvA [Pseudomonadota bacterium]